MRRPLGSAIRERVQWTRSGPNIPESQRHTRRVRISRAAYDRAARVAAAEDCSVGEIIERALTKQTA